MARKGQYMAVEAVLSLGLSLIIAVAAVGVFGSYRDSMLDAIEDRNVEIAASEIQTALHNLGSLDKGSSISVDLPETGSRSYTISLSQDRLNIESGGSDYTYSLKGLTWASDLGGSASGTEFEIVRVENGVQVRS